MAKKPATPATPATSAISQFAAGLQDGAQPIEQEPAAIPAQVSEVPSPGSTPESQEVASPETLNSPAHVEGQPQDFLATVRNLGFADVADENSARDRLVEAYQQKLADLEARERRLQEVEPFAKYGQEYLETLRSKQEPTIRQPQAQQPSSWWSPPEYDAAMVRKYQKMDPATGAVQWSSDTPAQVRAKFEEYETYTAEWANKLMYRPKEALAAPIQEVVEQYLQDKLGMPISELPNRLDLSGERRAIEDLKSQYGDWIYPKNPVTNQLDSTRLTPFGEAIEQAVNEARDDLKIASTQAQLKYALAIAHAKFPPQTQSPAPEKREQTRREVRLRNGATGLPQRNGTATRDGQPQNKNLSPGQQFYDRLQGLAN